MSSARKRPSRGAGMTEYVVMVGLIGLLLIPVVQRFGRQIAVTFAGSAGVVGDLSKASYTGSAPKRSGTGPGPDGRWHATDQDGKAISAPDMGGEPGNWVYD
jgi:Flp pilus assembly pilin Flp